MDGNRRLYINRSGHGFLENRDLILWTRDIQISRAFERIIGTISTKAASRIPVSVDEYRHRRRRLKQERDGIYTTAVLELLRGEQVD